MRSIIILAAGLTFIGTMSANAQSSPSQEPPQQPPMTAPATPDAATTIKSVSVVDITELSPDTQTQVNEVVGKQSGDDRQKMRSAIEATPEIKAALETRGMTSEQVIATSLSTDGVLTLITKKAS